MEFGSFAEFHARPGYSQPDIFNESFEHVDQAESMGLDGVWLSESHFNPVRSVMSSPLMVASAIAGRTKRLKIGTAVHIIPLGNPLRMAEEVATLDHVSQGRFEYGVGRSGLPGSYEGYGMAYAESRQRFYEYLNIMNRAWTNERFSYSGDYYSYDDVCLTPKPFQQPHPKIRVAATTSDTFETLGTLGYPIFIGVRSLDMFQVKEQVDAYKKAWNDAGHEGPIDVSLRVPVYVSESKDDALSAPEDSFMKQFRRLGGQLAASVSRSGSEARDLRSERGAQLAEVDWERVQREKVAVGTPEMVIEQLNIMKDTLSLSGVVAEFNAGEGISKQQIATSLRLICEKVMPAFK
jgi:alkanesulfonate monooxygenase SsuD/methylene tetrahydromethanopterin reductase-like flavin-dependent oxidoreductase (luciferase family)